jgi:hypothetical protein
LHEGRIRKVAELRIDLSEHDVHAWLSRIGAVQRPCDVDVLLFFATHRRTLMTLEQLAPLLGWRLEDIASGLERLIRAGFVSEFAHPTGPHRLFVCAPAGANDQQLQSFVAFASAREGRLALQQALTAMTDRHAGDSPTPVGDASDPAAS